jgi:hypothetical protein
MKKDYAIILTFTFVDQSELYVRWEIDLYFNIRSKGILSEFFYDNTKTGFQETPISVEASLYSSPEIRSVVTPYGREQLLVGEKLHVIDFF